MVTVQFYIYELVLLIHLFHYYVAFKLWWKRCLLSQSKVQSLLETYSSKSFTIIRILVKKASFYLRSHSDNPWAVVLTSYKLLFWQPMNSCSDNHWTVVLTTHKQMFWQPMNSGPWQPMGCCPDNPWIVALKPMNNTYTVFALDHSQSTRTHFDHFI